MKLNFNRKETIAHIIAIIIMIVVAAGFCLPEMNGKVLSQDDTINYQYLSKETQDFRDEFGEEPLWTSRVFSGMPTFFITYVIKTNISRAIDLALRSPFAPTMGKLFVLFVGFYILLTALGVNKWLALIGAIGYGLSSNLIVSIIAGHNTKVLAIAYLAPAIAGALLTYFGKKNLGAILLLISLSLLIKSGHYQIVYYFILVSLVIAIVFLIEAIKQKSITDFIQKSALLLITGIIALLPNLGIVYSAYDHQAETIRGGKLRLKTEENKDSKSGLDKEYAMRWSYGPMETMTTLIPSFKGGASNEALPKEGEVAKALNQFNLQKKQKEQLLKYGPLYIGDQPFILGTVYFGTIFIFLFILSLFVIKGSLRNVTIGILILFLIISWGRHADAITSLFYNYLPGYNKFRTPSMAMAVLGILIPFFGLFGLSKVFKEDYTMADFKKHFKYSLLIMGGLMVLLLFYGLTNDWIGPNDEQLKQRQPWSIDQLYSALLEDRKGRYMSDWFIALVTLVLAVGAIWLHKTKKLAFTVAVTILGLVIGVDMWRVGKRYLNEESFMSKSEFDNMMKPTAVDKEILADQDPHYRVLDLSLNPWTDGRTSYHHENIGGHHAAKLQRYQDLIEFELSPEIQKLNSLLRQSPSGISVAPNSAAEIPALSMLNAKYLILKPDQAGGKAINPNACGNAWFVSNVDYEETGLAEMEALKTIDPSETAILNNAYKDQVIGSGKSSDASISLVSFQPNELVYQSNNSENGLGIFSEIYYENGWKAFIDNQETPIIRANYVLRALPIPSGKHEIKMVFEPNSDAIGSKLSLAGSSIFVLFIIGLIFREVRSSKKED